MHWKTTGVNSSYISHCCCVYCFPSFHYGKTGHVSQLWDAELRKNNVLSKITILRGQKEVLNWKYLAFVEQAKIWKLMIPCFAVQCSTPQSGWGAHSWRFLSRWGCWCLHPGPQHVHCSGPAWPKPSHMLSVSQSTTQREEDFLCCIHSFACVLLRSVCLCTHDKPSPQPCSWEHLASWCFSG